MKKKLAAVTMAIMTLFASVSAQASEVISEGFSDMALTAQHYYNTNVAEYPMTLSHPNENMYVIESVSLAGKRTELTLIKKEWGTWNLGDFNFYDEGIQKNVIGGNTDWEYTFKMLNQVTQMGEFVGGNHGSEEFVSLELKDGVSGESFTMNAGDVKDVKRLVIKEKTRLLINNNKLLPFAEVERTYTVTGNTVTLDTDIEFIRDVQLGLSYSAMACINKDYGRFCNFDGLEYVAAEGKGKSTDAWLGNMPAVRCDIHGDDPSVAVYVGIFNKKDMTDNFSNSDKVFLWDMDDKYTKLYFSRFSKGSLETVNTGTKWHFSAYWQVNIW